MSEVFSLFFSLFSCFFFCLCVCVSLVLSAHTATSTARERTKQVRFWYKVYGRGGHLPLISRCSPVPPPLSDGAQGSDPRVFFDLVLAQESVRLLVDLDRKTGREINGESPRPQYRL